MADKETVEKLESLAFRMRANLLDLAHRTTLHIGGDLSMADMMTALYLYKMRYDLADVKWPERDRFVLSKGHGAGCLYIAMAMAGFWTIDDIFGDYGKIGSRFGMHPCKNQNPGMDVSSGSLGHGVSIGAGMAKAAKDAGKTYRIYTLLGDGEMYEGSVWEGAMAAANFELGNLVALVDRNRLSFNAATEDKVFGMRMEPVADKWRAFGWNVFEIDGNDMGQVVDALDAIPPVDCSTPTVIIGETTKGKGVSFMENQPKWHSGKLKDEQYEEAISQLRKAYGREA